MFVTLMTSAMSYQAAYNRCSYESLAISNQKAYIVQRMGDLEAQGVDTTCAAFKELQRWDNYYSIKAATLESKMKYYQSLMDSTKKAAEKGAEGAGKLNISG